MRKLLFCLLLPTALSNAFPDASSQSEFLSTARERTAYTYLVAGTLIPIAAGLSLLLSSQQDAVIGTGAALALGGLVIGPAAGEFYTGAYIRGGLASAARVLGGALWLTGAASNVTRCIEKATDRPGCDDGAGTPLVILGGLVYLGATMFSLIDTHYAVLQEEESSARIGLVPILARAPKGGIHPGLAAWARF